MTAAQWSICFTLALSGTSCAPAQTGSAYIHPLIKEKIKAYIKLPEGRANQAKVLTIVLTVQHDTVHVELAPTYPDAAEASVTGYDTLAQYHLFFIGEALPAYYRSKDANPQAAQLALKNLLFTRYGHHPLPGFNYRIMSYWFVKGHLLQERKPTQRF